MRFLVLFLFSFINLFIAESVALVINTNLPTEDIKVLLISGPECETCDVFAKIRLDKDYDDVLYIEGHSYPIVEVDKSAMPNQLSNLFKQQALQSKGWSTQLTVAVIDNGTLLYQGDITQSSEDNELNLEYFVDVALYENTQPIR